VRFAFTEEQRLFARSMRELCARVLPPAELRAAWSGGAEQVGRARARWAQLADVGALGLTVPAAHGGLDGSALDWVLPLEEAGRAALPEPLAETVAVAAPLVAALAPASPWLARIAEGRAVVTVAVDTRVVPALDLADLVLVRHGDEVHALAPAQLGQAAQTSFDGARHLGQLTWTPSDATCLGVDARRAWDEALDRGALAAAAQLVGIGQRLIELTVEYVKVRRQFGQPVGSFQAVKHHLTDALMAVEFARPLVYHGAWSLAGGRPSRALDVSMAKAAASDAADRAARAALQCHGAIGYSFEHDLHLWMKRAWALAAAWGDATWHRARVATAILDEETHHG
jgi:alkylation response protein AidB-like acyl-CoA dehydrogenase